MDNHQINPVRNSDLSKKKAVISNGVKAIIFDLGNVLVDFDHRIASQRISKFTPLETIGKQEKDRKSLTGFTDKNEQEIFNLFFDSELTALFEAGRIPPLQFFLKVKERLNLELDYDKFVPIWNEIFFLTEKNLDIYSLALNLKSRYKLSVLSNINILHFDYIKKTFPVFSAFHYTLTSCGLGLRKPESQIYKKALEIIGVLPAETFYTDDRPELVESAKGLGIQAFVFTGTERLKEDLLSAGVNI